MWDMLLSLLSVNRRLCRDEGRCTVCLSLQCHVTLLHAIYFPVDIQPWIQPQEKVISGAELSRKMWRRRRWLLEMSYLFDFRRLTSDATPPFPWFFSVRSDSYKTCTCFSVSHGFCTRVVLVIPVVTCKNVSPDWLLKIQLDIVKDLLPQTRKQLNQTHVFKIPSNSERSHAVTCISVTHLMWSKIGVVCVVPEIGHIVIRRPQLLWFTVHLYE